MRFSVVLVVLGGVGPSLEVVGWSEEYVGLSSVTREVFLPLDEVSLVSEKGDLSLIEESLSPEKGVLSLDEVSLSPEKGVLLEEVSVSVESGVLPEEVSVSPVKTLFLSEKGRLWEAALGFVSSSEIEIGLSCVPDPVV